MPTTTEPHPTGTSDRGGTAFTRVLVTLTTFEGSRTLIETAYLAARATDATLAALYIREERLADLAALPFAAVLVPGRGTEALTLGAIERAWAHAEAACRNALHAVRPAMTATFETAKGRIEAVIADRVSPDDLVVLAAGSSIPAAPPEAFVKTVAAAAGAVLVVPTTSSARAGPVVAIDDGDQAGAGTLRLASRLAQASGRQLALLSLASPASHGAFGARARGIAGAVVTHHAWPVHKAAGIAAALVSLAPSMVVTDLAGLPFASPGTLGDVLRRLPAPLLLLSGRAARQAAQIVDAARD